MQPQSMSSYDCNQPSGKEAVQQATSVRTSVTKAWSYCLTLLDICSSVHWLLSLQKWQAASNIKHPNFLEAGGLIDCTENGHRVCNCPWWPCGANGQSSLSLLGFSQTSELGGLLWFCQTQCLRDDECMAGSIPPAKVKLERCWEGAVAAAECF